MCTRALLPSYRSLFSTNTEHQCLTVPSKVPDGQQSRKPILGRCRPPVEFLVNLGQESESGNCIHCELTCHEPRLLGVAFCCQEWVVYWGVHGQTPFQGLTEVWWVCGLHIWSWSWVLNLYIGLILCPSSIELVHGLMSISLRWICGELYWPFRLSIWITLGLSHQGRWHSYNSCAHFIDSWHVKWYAWVIKSCGCFVD